MVARFDNEREALNELEYQIQIHMRNYKQAKKEIKRVKITVAIHPIIEKLLNRYAQEHDLEPHIVMERIMKCTKKR